MFGSSDRDYTSQVEKEQREEFKDEQIYQELIEDKITPPLNRVEWSMQDRPDIADEYIVERISKSGYSACNSSNSSISEEECWFEFLMEAYNDYTNNDKQQGKINMKLIFWAQELNVPLSNEKYNE